MLTKGNGELLFEGSPTFKLKTYLKKPPNNLND
jgi:hypothetical protein